MSLTDNERDLNLWNQFKTGDEDAFVELFRIYYPGLFAFGCKITLRNELVEDCIQELFIDIWRTKGKADIISFKAYIFKAFKFTLIRQLNKQHKIAPLPDTGETGFEISHENLIASREMNLEQKEKLLNAFSELSPRQKEIIYLRIYQDFSYEEVSEIMQINYQAARNLFYQSVKNLKKMIFSVFF